jgi:O-antigen/teichoic acid export membrane protein
MKNPFFTLTIGIIGYFYEKFFHEEVSVEIEKFIMNLSYLGIGTIIASVFGFSFNILAGRWLGPSEYGSFTLVQSVAMFLYIPMMLGFHSALVKYNTEKIDFLRQRCIISTTFILVSLFTIVSLFIYFIFSEQFMNIFSISKEVFYFALVFAVLFVFYTLMTETMRSLHRMKEYSLFNPIFSIILLCSFLVFILIFKEPSFKSPLFSMFLAYGITGGILLAFLRKYLRPEFSWSWAKKLQAFSRYSLISGISFVFYMNFGKIVINMYLPVSNVGIYWAYHYSFTSVIVLLSSIFVTVFFPVASMCQDKGMLFGRINKIVLLLIIFGWPLALVTGFILLKLYGTEYPFDLSLTLLFASAGICLSVDQLYSQLVCSVGVNGAKIESYACVVLAGVNIILNFLLIPIIGLTGAIVATIISYLFKIGIMTLKWQDLVNSG